MKTKAKDSNYVDMIPRLRRVAGQVEGIQRMIEARKYCLDILTQIQAVRSAMRAVELHILQRHMAECVNAAMSSGSGRKAKQMMEPLLRVMQKQY